MSNGEPQELFALPVGSQDVVAMPSTAIVQSQPQQLDEFAAAERSIKMFDKLREISLRMTRPHEWHFFGERPWPQRGAVEKIMRALGLSLKIHANPVDGLRYTKRMAQDEQGGYYIITVSGEISGQWGTLEAMGFTSSRDMFFGWDSTAQEFKPLSQVKEENIIQAAYTNFVANAVMRYTGISMFTRADLEAAFGEGAVSSHAYRESKQKTTTAQVASSSSDMKRLWALCLVMSDGLESEAQNLLVQMSAFKGKDGSMVPGLRDVSKLSPGRLTNTLRTAEKWWKEFLGKSGDQAGFYEGLLTTRLAGGE